MALLSMTATDRLRLTVDACDAIRQGHDDTWADIIRLKVRRPQWEPRFVAFLCGAMADVATRWRPTIRASHPSARLSATTVFTHQTPAVKWPPTNRCELADLLIALIDRTTSTPHGVAVLIQAKQADTQTIALSGRSEKTQFDLLARRPVFDVDQTSAPTNVDLSGFHPDVALLYGLTPPDVTPPATPVWRADRWHTGDQLGSAHPAYNVTAATCLADTLVEMLVGSYGWPFYLPPAATTWTHFAGPVGRDEWSMLINFLLEKTFATSLTTLQSTIGGSTRGRDHALYLQGNTVSRKTKFLMANWAASSSGAMPLSWIQQVDDLAERWFPVSNSPLFELGGGGGGDVPPPEDPTDPGWENGPMSAVVFELSNDDGGPLMQ